MAQSKGNGAGVGDFVTGSLIEKHNIKAILVDTGGDLRSEDDATREAVERALQNKVTFFECSFTFSCHYIFLTATNRPHITCQSTLKTDQPAVFRRRFSMRSEPKKA